MVGLGNPGREYAYTPHNVGFLVAEALGERWGLPRPKTRFRGLLSEGRIDVLAGPAVGADAVQNAGEPASARRLRVALLMPQTYMNEAGRAVGPARGSYKLDLDRVLVVHDEIDLPFGELRTRLGGGLAGHNGLKSLKRELGGTEFWRVRVGVGRPNSADPEIVAGYVLGRFRQRPEDVRELVDRACAEVERAIVEQSDERQGHGGGTARAGGDG